ncbi:FAD/NAD(P)-binding domain-containing protein [Mollisia scopiformis]|uniref:FAD/NAD(P)-binding domain-containing protein n=1 Tax=Mollisia scopiformis TaxID=149040 RepID=A0A194XHU6_MOLSC|nr:FAD/NAD(P)-binding domain-containing protein [Mollisia scopiformis]KUJ19699.1 FAD/NAD(P)-binding domain-containing protein [Mollisia scopiformis]
MSSSNKLKIIIVGSGLAVLAVARILRDHHQATVYERGDEAVATGGQGIILASNGVKILRTIGYDSTRAGAVPILGIRTYDKEGNVLEDADMDLEARFGEECLAQKRSDFRDELLRLATAPSAELDIEGDPAEMVFSTQVVDLEPEEGVVTLSDGSTAAADVVIVADGVHSRLRNRILGSNGYTAKKVGLTCYRVAISVEDAKRALDGVPLPHWWEPSTCKNRSSLLMSNDCSFRVVTCYPIRYHTYFNLSIIKLQGVEVLMLLGPTYHHKKAQEVQMNKMRKRNQEDQRRKDVESYCCIYGARHRLHSQHLHLQYVPALSREAS